MPAHDTAGAGILRLAPGLRHLPRRDGGAILLTRTGRYVRIGNSTWCFLRYLSDQHDGLAAGSAAQAYPLVDIDSLVSRSVIDYVPPFGQVPGAHLAAQLWRRNVAWRAKLRLRGWSALEPLTANAPGDGADMPSCRPAALDRVEAAARLSLALPGTSAQCTVVSAAIHGCLRSMGFPARIVLLGSADQFMFHARAYVGSHPVDPADALVDLEPFRV
jgi:hypothetical protein